MSKTKQRESSEVEHLRGRVRKLESQNRQLRRRLKSLDKREHLYEDLIEAVSEDIVIDDKCKKCKVGKTRLLDLNHVRFMVCDNPDCLDKIKL